MDSPQTTTLLTTLGGQPQIVTFALDALLQQGVPITHLILLHLSPANGRIQNALHKIATEFTDGRYGERPLTYQQVPIRAGASLLRDIHNETDANSAWETINSLIIQLKNQRQTLHICISGGRRILGLLTMSAAMLHFGHQDVLWHMYTPDDIRRQANEGAQMHLSPDSGFRLIRVPMMPWGSYFPALRQMTRPVMDSTDVLAGPRTALDRAEQARCQAVVNNLTDRQRDVLRAFAAGLNPQQAAAHLVVSIKTIDSHKTVILAECRNAWALPEDDWLDYHFLADKFGRFF